MLYNAAMSWYRKLHWQIIIGLILGLIYGIIAAGSGWGKFTADWIAPFGKIFVSLLKLIAVPLVIASLITGVASLSDLRKLSKEQQIRCIAWMCVIANADGFMDRKEWQFIYKIYHKELNISLDEIMKVQNELIRLTMYKAPNVSEQVRVRA